MAINIIEDVLMPVSIMVIITVGTLVALQSAQESAINKVKLKSDLHNTVISSYRDDCLKKDKKSREECSNDAVELAIANGYSDKLPGIFSDAGGRDFVLNQDQLSRLGFPSTAD